MQRGIKHVFAAMNAFFRTRRSLVFFTVLFLAGCLAGIQVFCRADAAAALAGGLIPAPVKASFGEILRAVGASCFAGWLLLLVLYLTGLSPCGLLAAVLVPLFYGMGIGLSEAAQYGTGPIGVASSALFIVPHAVLCTAALLIGCCETARMSAVIGRQLFPASARGGEISQSFRLYSLRFLLLAALVLLAGVADTVLRVLFYPLS